MSAVSLAVETVRGTERTRLTLTGPTPEVVAALHRLIGSPGVPQPEGTTTLDWVSPDLLRTNTTQAAPPRRSG